MALRSEHLRKQKRLVIAPARTVKQQDGGPIAPDGNLGQAVAGVDQGAAPRQRCASFCHLATIGTEGGRRGQRR